MPLLSPLNVRSVKDGWILLEPLHWDIDGLRFAVPAGFKTDLASIPSCLRWIISNDNPNIRAPAVLHDYLLALGDDRNEADQIFYLALRECGVNSFVAFVMFLAVWLYTLFVAGRNNG